MPNEPLLMSPLHATRRRRRDACALLAGLWLVCGAWAQNIASLTADKPRHEPMQAVEVTLSLERPSAGCSVVLDDGLGHEQRVVVRGANAHSTFRYAQDGRYRVRAQGKPGFEGYDLFMACEGQANLTVVIESKANRAKRLAAEAAAKKAAEARAQELAAQQAAQAQAAEEAKREAERTDIERQKAALEAAARQRAVDLEKRKQEARAELAAAKALAKKQAEQTPLDRIKALFAKEAPAAPAQPAGPSATEAPPPSKPPSGG